MKKLKDELDESKELMLDNIEKLIDRGEKMEILV
jgi:hypothetical protein